MTQQVSSEHCPVNDVEFFNQVVVPAIEDFRGHPGDIRRGVTACILLWSMTEHYFLGRLADPSRTDNQNKRALAAYKKEAIDPRPIAGNWIIKEIAEIANGAKHAMPKFFSLSIAAPATCGVMRCGFPLTHGPHLFSDSNHSWLLVQLTDAMAESWREKLGILESDTRRPTS